MQKQDALIIEEIRKKYNTEQFRCIQSHITLCRESELQNIDKLIQHLKISDLKTITVELGQAVRFADGKGVFIPGKGKNEAFRDLRKFILADNFNETLEFQPHITLIHPRNGTCTDRIFDFIRQYNFPSSLSFDNISLIEEQQDGLWQVLDVIELK
ncbi:MAG: 2'-5' RNA ligase family protein [Saprospiraceae bacterium]|nr:2'-5' RNA ligase family protein [Saprospiraceae bacterium]